MTATYEKIKKILKGIDQDETYIDGGWWETITGAEFGSRRLAEIKSLFEDEGPVVGIENCSEVNANEN